MGRGASFLIRSLVLIAACLWTSSASAQQQLPKLPDLPAAQEIPTAPLPPPPQVYILESELGEGEARPIVRTQGVGRGKPMQEQEIDFTIAIELPGQERLFQRFSEAQVFKRIEESARTKPGTGRVFFPEYPPLTKEEFRPRAFPPMVEVVEPLVLEHGRLYFEQKNFERQGWDLGFMTMAVNLGVFYYDVAMFPYHFWTRPCNCCDSSAGKCLPGDPTPLYLYHEPFSITGLAGEAAVIISGFFIFP